MCRDCKGCADHGIQTAAALVTAIRRKGLFGSTVPVALQGKVAPAPRSKFTEEQAAMSRDPLTQARMRLTEIRRRQLTGRERPVFLQAAVGADPSYPESSYPRKNDYPVDQPNNVTREITREINLEDEKLRELAFGYSRNEKGEKVPYSTLARAHTVKWTCPNCGCSYNLPA